MLDTKTLKRSADNLIKLEDIESLILTPAPSPAKRSRSDSYESPGSNCSNSSDDSFTPTVTKKSTGKRRGRPPKTETEVLSPSKFPPMKDSDWKYVVMRHKNNEASRRSRLQRKGKETKIFTEAQLLEQDYDRLIKEEHELKKECAKWRRALMRLAVL